MAVGIEDFLDLTGGSGASVRIWYTETYDIEKNTSTVAITSIQVMSTWFAGVTYYLDGTISIAGTVAVSMSSSGGTHPVTISAMNQYYTAGGSLGSVSGIAHLNDGSQSVTVSATIRGYTISGGAGSGWSASGSKVSKLTTIPRKSSLTASNGTLGVAQTLKVTKKADSFTHTITYKCRDESGTICSKSKDTSIAWTPPIELAEQNMTGTSVTVNLTITTYSGSTTIGSSTVPVSYAIPESVAPTCSLRIQDYSGFDTTYGGMIKGCSRMVIMVDSETQYGAIISSHRISADGVVYTEPSVITDYIKSSGTLTVTATVTDSRGRTASASMDVEVMDYSIPTVSVLKVRRCNEDGSVNESGDFVQVTFSSEVTALNGKNTALYKLEYKKYTESEYTAITLADYMNQYSVTDGTYIFAADGGSTYEVRLSITDNFNTGRRTVPVSTGATIMHFLASGNGMGIGKMGELENTLDIGWDIQMNGKKVSGLPTPTEDNDAVSKAYVDEVAERFANERVSMELVWENASQGSAFDAQTVSLDLSNAGFVIIEFRTTNTGTARPTVIIANGKMGNLNWLANATANYEILLISRNATVSDTGIAFDKGYRKTVSSTTATENNASAIPTRIYAIKGVR